MNQVMMLFEMEPLLFKSAVNCYQVLDSIECFLASQASLGGLPRRIGMCSFTYLAKQKLYNK